METTSKDQQGKQGQQPSSLIQISTKMNFIQRRIYADRLLNKMFSQYHFGFCQTGDHHLSIHSRMQIISHRSDLLKLVGANMNVLLALRLLTDDKRIPQFNSRSLYKMAKRILSRKNIQNQVVSTEIVGSPQIRIPLDLTTSKCHPSGELFARMSLNDTRVFVQGPNGGNANCISVLSQKHGGYICSKCGLEWHHTRLILLVFNLVCFSTSEVNLYEVSLEDQSVKCILTIPVPGVVFSILPHRDSFIMISRYRYNDTNMMKIWRICLETLSMECIETLLSPLYTMNVFSLLIDQMIIADAAEDGLSLTISNRSDTLVCINFTMEHLGFNRVSSIKFLADNIIAIGTDCGKIKMFHLSPDYLSMECFASFKGSGDIFPNGGMITYPIRHITDHPSEPSIFAAIVKTYSVKIFKWSSDRIVVLAEINVNKDIRSIRFSTNNRLLIECNDGSVEMW
jgi:hypothetical protein